MFIKPVTNPTLILSVVLAVLIVLPVSSFSQTSNNAKNNFDTIAIAGNYDRPESFEKKWGKHYRKEWSTPVNFKIVYLDTLAGGLIPYQKGGGRQSKTLRLRDKNNREYVLRSIDKSFGEALPEIYQGTFIESIINDQVTIGHPYAAIVVAPLAQVAGIYHTWPEIFFVPAQPALDSFNKEYGDQLYLFERRPDENWETADNFGNSKNIVGTEKMLEELLEDNDHQVDQLLFVRSRLFDFFIGDWGRHEDQWRWAGFENDSIKLYKPIPRDRDQAFSKFDGSWLKAAISFGDLDHLQTFSDSIKDIRTYTFTARNLDRRIANEVSQEQWIAIAKDIQVKLSDDVIERSVNQLPPEVFPISGNEIISKLKSRRDHLVQNATEYYLFLAKAVDVVGSDKKEFFEVKRLDDEKTEINVYKITKNNETKDAPFYQRTFYTNETDEIRLYGLGDNDLFQITGRTNKGILLRVIGGTGTDIVIDTSSVAGGKKLTRVYDNDSSQMLGSGETRFFIKDDPSNNEYEYESFKYDKKGFGLRPGFFSLTFGYGVKKNEWRKEPLGSEQSIKIKYSINRNALYFDYQNILYQALGKWNFIYGAGAGVPNVVNFFGVGNNTSFETYDRSFFRLRSREFYGKAGVSRVFSQIQNFELNAFYQTIGIIKDSSRFVTSYIKETDNTIHAIDPGRKHFVGASAKYKFDNTDDPVIASKGFRFIANPSYTYNITTPSASFAKLASEASVYLPITKFLSFAVRAGGATNLGDAEFYQLNQLGSEENLRGYRKYRFYGKTSFYNNNELRFIFNARNKVFNGKYGFITFMDNGRVWQPGEISDKWHMGYGAGLFLSLFNKIIVSSSYGISNEDRVLSFYFGFYF